MDDELPGIWHSAKLVEVEGLAWLEMAPEELSVVSLICKVEYIERRRLLGEKERPQDDFVVNET